ncbi:HEAT repeat-containing protein 1 [Hypsibius exemplaris]|uniref:HEAT repeat-containing protein 1 n=1 Tax=Hypsibius exemplaris TaxID=2072580 RepID=A0A1W0WX06_HYPEX|nr:HEAT repeat-containing protein 1 [Hypsibius exemplaris]
MGIRTQEELGRPVKNFQQATEYILSISAAAAVAKTGSQTTVSQPKKRKTITSAFDKPLINANFTAAEHIRLITAMVTFVGYQIPSHAFRTTYQQQQQQAHAAVHGAAEESAAAALDRCLEQLLVSLLDIQSRARLQTRTSGKSAADTPAWAELLKRTSVAVTEILGQMSWSSFVTIMLGILRDTTPVMVKTALEELGGTLSLRAAITKADVPHLVPLIGALVGILESQTATKDLTAEGAGVQRGCLFCLKQLAGILGNHSAETWTTILSTGVKFLASSDISIRCEAISCLTTVIVTVKTSVLPRLPEFLPGLLEHVHQLLSGKAQDTASLLTAIDALEAIVSILTAFISPQLPKILAIVAQCATKTVQPTLKDSFSGKVVRIRGILCGDVPFRVMFGAFKETYGALRQTEVFSIFNDSLKKARTGDILSMQREIVDFLFTVFDTREDLPSALDALSLVALRMPESSFKGLFMKLYQWATQDGLQRKKLLTFYQIVERLTDALKHLFIIYAANVVSHAVTIMSAFHVEKSAGSISESDRQTETDVLITILDVLTRFFKYDTTGYFNADQCDVLNQPLVDQLDNYREPESYKRLVEHLIPAITGFSVCLNDDSLWKPLHYQVLLKTRHDEAAVRVAALQSIESLVESMGESYSNLLPEAVTFLVELSAEDDELVEAQCARTKATIEKVLGDSSIWRNAV